MALLSAPASAFDFEVTQLEERLDSGESWRTSSVALAHKTEGAQSTRVGLNLEQESRRAGEVQRTTLSIARTLGASTAGGVAVGAGTGAAYGVRNTLALSVYKGFGATYLESALTFRRYANATSQTLSALMMHPLGERWMLLGGAAVARNPGREVGWSANVGVQYAAGRCTVKAQMWRGFEAAEVGGVASDSQHSVTSLLGATCAAAERLKVTAHVSDTRAGSLSRSALYVGLNISF